MTSDSAKPSGGVLLPCPFCGGSAKHTAIRDGRQTFCGDCHASGPPKYHGPFDKPSALKRAIDGWNNREAVVSAVKPLVEALAKADALLNCTVDSDWRDMNLEPPSREDRDERRAAIAPWRHLLDESGE